MPKLFCHGGDLGDLIYSLPTIRALGGGRLVLCPQLGLFGNGLPLPAVKMTAERANAMFGLLTRQCGISTVGWQPEYPAFDNCVNLNAFRYVVAMTKRTPCPQLTNLAHMHLAAFGLALSEADYAWLHCAKPSRVAGRPLVVARSLRRHADSFPWQELVRRYEHLMVFLGLEEEYTLFSKTYSGQLVWHVTSTLSDAASIVAGARCFIGNESSLFAIAEAMKKPVILERTLPDRNVFARSTGLYTVTTVDAVFKFIDDTLSNTCDDG
jgi:hypothetical protein